MYRFLTAAISLILLLSGCGSGDSGARTEEATGYIFVDATGSRICESQLESYPPQCGEPSVTLLDLDTQSVVALDSPTDQTDDTVTWTGYETTVTGTMSEDGMSNVMLDDPTYQTSTGGLVLRVADLGIPAYDSTTWPFDLTNLTDESMTLTFMNGQRVEVTLSDDSGELYRWSTGMFFDQAIEVIDLAPGATLPFVVYAGPTGLIPGTYTAQAWFTAEEVLDVVVTWTVTVHT